MAKIRNHYRIDCFVPVKVENPEVYEDIENAESEMDNLEDMNPDNIYMIALCDAEGNNLEE
jgi:hypothetical protein